MMSMVTLIRWRAKPAVVTIVQILRYVNALAWPRAIAPSGYRLFSLSKPGPLVFRAVAATSSDWLTH